jgi:hypothetical protein
MIETRPATWPVLAAAYHALRTVVAPSSVADAQRPTAGEKWIVTQVVLHAAGDQLGYAGRLTGAAARASADDLGESAAERHFRQDHDGLHAPWPRRLLDATAFGPAVAR